MKKIIVLSVAALLLGGLLASISQVEASHPCAEGESPAQCNHDLNIKPILISSDLSAIGQLQALITRLLALIEELKARIAAQQTQCELVCPSSSTCRREYVCAPCQNGSTNCPCAWTSRCIKDPVTASGTKGVGEVCAAAADCKAGLVCQVKTVCPSCLEGFGAGGCPPCTTIKTCQSAIPSPTSDPVKCSAAYATCNAHACRFSNNVCDLNEQKQCQATYTSCLAKLPQACVRAYQQCKSPSYLMAPCPEGGCLGVKTDAECLAEYTICAKNPPAEHSVCRQTLQRVCWAGPMEPDPQIAICDDGSLVYQSKDSSVLYHGTQNTCR